MTQESPNLEKEKIIAEIVNKLKSQEFSNVWMGESIGGNAGENKVAVNSWVYRKTGEIIKFGNWQGIESEVKNNPEFGEATFWYDVGTLVPRTGFKGKNPYFVDVLNTKEEISEEGMSNLKEAIRRINATNQ